MHSRTPLTPALEALRARLDALGPGRVWRPVPAPDGSLLAPGDGSDTADLRDYIGDLDVAGKTVADLGCNLGYFSFMARRLGARRVVGCDVDPEIVALAGELARLHGLGDVAFTAVDFLLQKPETPCDMTLCIDFIGRQVVSKGRVPQVAAANAAWGARELFFTLRPVYRLEDLPAPPETLARLYPGFVRDGCFFLAETLAHCLGPHWSMRVLPNARKTWKPGERVHKAALLFTRLDAEQPAETGTGTEGMPPAAGRG